jgi:hypothetical protein
MRLDVGLLAVWLCAALASGQMADSRPGGTVPALDSERAPKAPPFLFFTADEIARARQNAKTASLKPVFEALKSKADEALTLKLEPFSTDWWHQAKTKTWADTYPEVFLHTWVEPMRVATSLDSLVRYALIADDERAWTKAEEVLLHLASFSFEPEHFDVGMNYSVWSISVLRAYDALYPRRTADERRRLDDFFTRLGRAVLRNDAYWIANNVGGGINNHLAWHKMMLGLLGLFYDQRPMVDYCLHGPRGLIELLELGSTDDGLWCEGALTYHFAAIAPMTLFADAARRCGYREDLFTMTVADGRTLKQTLDSMFGVLFPDGTIPPIGDAYGRRPNLAENPVYEYGWAAWRDPAYAWLLSRSKARTVEALFVPPLPEDSLTASGATGSLSAHAPAGKPPVAPASAETHNTSSKLVPPSIASRLFPEHGYAFLRTRRDAGYWDSDARCAMLTYDRSGVHSHADKLSLMLFGCGKLLLPDVEGRATVPHAFSSRIQNELNRGGLSQNTVMIDGRDQRGTPDRLDLIEYRDLPAEKRITAADRRGVLYEGVRQQRTICLTDGYCLDVFQVVCDSPRQIDWILHILDEKAQRTAGPETRPCEPPGKDEAWAWLHDFRSSWQDPAWHVTWRSGDVYLRLDTMAGPGTEVVECGYPATDEPATGRIPMLIVRRKAASAILVAVYTCGRSTPGEVKLTALPDRDGRLAYEVETPGGRGVHLVPRLTGPK